MDKDIVSNVSNEWKMDKQQIELKGLRQDFDKLKAFVHSMLPRIDKIEKEKDDHEQYGRSNCLIVHGCKEAPKRGEHLKNENYICNL